MPARGPPGVPTGAWVGWADFVQAACTACVCLHLQPQAAPPRPVCGVLRNRNGGMQLSSSPPLIHLLMAQNVVTMLVCVQEWPPEMEAFIKTMKMPSGEVVGAADMSRGLDHRHCVVTPVFMQPHLRPCCNPFLCVSLCLTLTSLNLPLCLGYRCPSQAPCVASPALPRTPHRPHNTQPPRTCCACACTPAGPRPAHLH